MSAAHGAASGDAISGAVADQPEEVRPYPFDLYGPLSEREWKGLVRFQEALVQEWALVLTQWLKRRVRIQAAGPPVTLRRASSLWAQGEGEAFRWHVAGAPVLLIWPMTLLFQTLDCLLGGPGETPVPLRPPTEIEARVIRQITARLAYRLLRLEVQRLELPVPPGEMEVLPVEPGQVSARSRWFSLAMDVSWRSQRAPAGHGSTRMYLLLSPEWAARARKGLAGLGRGVAGEAEELEDLQRARATLQRHLEETPVTLRVVLGRSCLTLQEILSLEPGDVLQLDQRVDEPLPVEVGESTFFLGRPGEASGRLAVQLERWVGGSQEPAEAGEKGGSRDVRRPLDA